MTIEKDLLLMSACIFMPSLFALAVLFVPKGKEEAMRWLALVGTVVTFIVSTFIFVDYLGYINHNNDPALAKLGEFRADPVTTSLNGRAADAEQKAGANEPSVGTNLLARYPWIARFSIEYYLGVDGISMAMILLTTVLFVLSMIASWGIEKHVKGYCMLFLILETGVLGTFFALDFFLFYIFWEVMLLPMYFLIGIWGGPRREYAAIKFFLYTLFGSVFILIALLGFYFTDVQDFAYKTTVEIAKTKLVDDLKARNPKAATPAVANKAQPKKGGEKGPGKGKAPKFDFEKEALKQVEVHTFDLVVLAKAGKGAMHWLALQDDIIGREIYVQQIVERRKKDGIETDERAVEARLNQMFFGNKTFQIVMFVFLFVGFAIKVPVFPFHTWLPDAHVEAPTPISMILAGILLKLGGYGILRIAYPICPWAAQFLAWYICILAMINIIYGAFAAMAQTDFKKLVAYSSISHMGYVLLGIAVWQTTTSQYWAWGMNGAMYQMIAHGISSAGMFFCVGVIYDRAHHRNLDNFRGLNEPMPLYGGISAVIFFAGLGLPGLCGFVGEFFVVLSAWSFSTPDYPNAGKVFAVLAALTVVITAAYILWTLQRVYLGTNPAYKDFKDITPRELVCIVPLLVLAILLGVLPMLVLQWMEPHVTGLVDALVQARM